MSPNRGAPRLDDAPFCGEFCRVLDPEQNDQSARSYDFQTTRWSIVVRAGNAADSGAHDALASLCRDYWKPLYRFARRRGMSPEDSQDATQGFILALLEANSIAAADRERGRFRTFLLSSFSNFLCNWHRAATAGKRGGNATFVTIHAPEVEAAFSAGLQDTVTPEVEFDRSWALAMLARVMSLLESEYAGEEKTRLFAAMQPHLSGAAGQPGYGEIGASLGMAEGAVRVAMHRMRKRYGQLLRDEIAATASSPEDAEDELRYLISVISA